VLTGVAKSGLLWSVTADFNKDSVSVLFIHNYLSAHEE